MPARFSRALLAYVISMVLLTLPACAQSQASLPGSGNPPDCVENYDPATDYFPDKVTFGHATGVSVSYTSNSKLLRIDRPWKDADESFSVLLVQCGTPAPDHVQADAIVQVPARSVATFSTTQLPSFALLDQMDAVVAHGGLQYVSTPEAVAAAADGQIAEVGDQIEPNVEALLDAEPELALLSAGIDGDTYREAIDTVGVAAIPYADWLEETVLGRAEWLKVVALLTNTERRAESTFTDIERAVQTVIDRAGEMTTHPKVVVGVPYEGTWFMPAGDSYVASALTALGADYPWADSKGTGALSLDLETVIDRAADAEIWLGAGSVKGTLDDLAAQDDRFDEFRALRTGTVYAEDRQVNESGGNALFELGAVRPDLVLNDLFKILYPDQAAGVDFTFYGRVGELRNDT